MHSRPRLRALVPVVAVIGTLLAVLGPAPTATAANGDISAVAGTFVSSGTALSLPMPPNSVTVLDGSILVSDAYRNGAWSISSTGTATAIVGLGHAIAASTNVVATTAGLVNGGGIAARTGHGVVVADSGEPRIHFIAASTCAASCPYGIATTAGRIYRLAGNGSRGSTGDGGSALSATIDPSYSSLAIDAAGNVFFAEQDRHVVRMIAATTCAGPTCAGGRTSTTAGNIYRIAGTTSSNGFSGDDGAATSAQLDSPFGVAVDDTGNVLIADSGSHRIRVVSGVAAWPGTLYGITGATFGEIYTIAGDGTSGSSGDDAAATSARVNSPRGITVDASSNVLIADTSNHRIRMIAAGTCAAGCYGRTGTVANRMYTVAGTGAPAFGGDGGAATSAGLTSPFDVEVDVAGNLIVADTGNYVVRVVPSASCTSCYGAATTAAGVIRTIAGNRTFGWFGDDAAATGAMFAAPHQSALDTSGNLFVADADNNRIRMVAASTCSTGCPFGTTTTAGRVYTLAGSTGTTTATDGVAATASGLNGPQGVAVDVNGNVLVGDTSNNRIRFVARTTCSASCPFGLASTVAGRIYTIAGTGTAASTGDGAAASSATVSGPGKLHVDALGNVLFTETSGHRVRMIAATACASSCRYGLTSTAVNSMYRIAGTGTSSSTGNNGPAASATVDFSQGSGLGTDSSGNLFIAEGNSHVVRIVSAATCAASCPFGVTTTAGTIKVLAGPAADLQTMSRPHDVAVDPDGNLVVSSWVNARVHLVARAACASSCPYGLGSTIAGTIYTIAGNGQQGATGDGGTATSASLYSPNGLLLNRTGDVLVTDQFNHRVRKVENRGFPDLTVTSSHTNPFTLGGTGTYTLTVTNNGTGPTVGTVQVVDTLPAGLTATALSGTGWSCILGTLTCTRATALAASASYPAITVIVDVASNASAGTNTAVVSGGGQYDHPLATADDTGTDATTYAAAATTTTTVAGGGGGGGGGTPPTTATSTTLAPGDPDPPDGATDIEIGRSDDPEGTVEVESGEASVEAEGEGSILVATYDDNPEDEEPPGEEDAEFFDVKVGASSSFRSVTVTRCAVPPDTTLWWHDGSRWRMVTPQSTAGGCVTTTLDDSSSPTPGELTGTVFAAGASPVSRVAGTNRVATAIAASQWAFPAGADAAVLARSDDFADALAGVPLAAAQGGPVLLTAPGSLDSSTLAELERVLEPGATVHLLGGESALTTAVEDAVRAAGFVPARIAGVDRFATAVAIAGALGDPTSIVEVSGRSFADAVTAGPAAVSLGAAILLTDGSAQAPATAAYLAGHPAATRVALGGPAASADPAATAIAGADRYATAAAVATTYFSATDVVGIATGTSFPDALAAGAALGSTGPVLLVASDEPSPALDAYLDDVVGGLRELVVFGGTAAVSSVAEAQLLGAFV